MGRTIGPVHATRFYRTNVRAVVARLEHDRRLDVWLAVAPAPERRTTTLPLPTRRIGQPRGDLGAKMQAMFDLMPPGPVVIVGTDIPGITAAAVVQVARSAMRASVAFAPTPDGGFWAVAARRTPRIQRPFKAVRWSTEHALADCLNNRDSIGAVLGPALIDVDDAGSYHETRDVRGRRVVPQQRR
ncbi:MAG: DUF2064 domain-containing protein [Hyphomicrobiaceae bacterium]